MADFRYFRTGVGDTVTYYRLDPGKPLDQRFRWSGDGIWNPSVIGTLSELHGSAPEVTEIPVEEVPCHLCMVVAGTVTRQVKADLGDALVIVPRPGGVRDGHLLVIPKVHVMDALEDPELTGRVTTLAARYAKDHMGGALNLATSRGKAATQTEPHLHIHLVPREWGDMLPFLWDTGGLIALDQLRVELIGCGHPAWPDPLGLNWGDDPYANARRWWTENREQQPQITVLRRYTTEWTEVPHAELLGAGEQSDCPRCTQPLVHHTVPDQCPPPL